MFSMSATEGEEKEEPRTPLPFTPVEGQLAPPQPEPQPHPEAQPEPQQQEQAQEQQPEPVSFDNLVKREYEYAMDQEIKKALNKINRRVTALSAQESGLIDVIKDALGHDSDWYQDLEIAVRNNDPRVGQTKEDVYRTLEALRFTDMKPLATIQQMYSMPQ